jgi:predicted RNase H-like HicB family nuclease
LQHCSAFGATPEEALREVLIAKKSWLVGAEGNYLEIPEAIYRPLIYQVA